MAVDHEAIAADQRRVNREAIRKSVQELGPQIERALTGRVGPMLVTRTDARYDADPEEVLAIAHLSGHALLEEFAAEFGAFQTTPFDPTGLRLRLYRGGLTIWSGFPGAGKTTLLRQFVVQLLAAGEGVFFASLEENPKHLLVRLAATAAGRELPDANQMQWLIDAYAGRLRLWGVIGLARHRRLLAAIRALSEQGITHAVIDSLMLLDIDNGDYEKQRQFANLLVATARASNVHIHLVAHPRKLISANQEPDINDVAGARELGGVADNVLFVRRDQQESTDPCAASTPMCVSIRKQRHGTGSLGDVTGWFHRRWRQFHLEQFPPNATRYLPAEAYTEPEPKWWDG